MGGLDWASIILIFIAGALAVFFLCILYFGRQLATLKKQIFERERKINELQNENLKQEVAKAQLAERCVQLKKWEENALEAEHKINLLQEENKALHARIAELLMERKKIQEFSDSRIKELQDMQEKMQQVFALLSQQALEKNASIVSQSFSKVIEQWQSQAKDEGQKNKESLSNVVVPLFELLKKVDDKAQQLEASRQGAYQGLLEQVDALQKTQQKLKDETAYLAHVLKVPTTRGRWGEMQLRRVVELAGLSAHCDFLEQSSGDQNNERAGRPDMIITLPAEKKIIVDAKAPLEAFVRSVDMVDEEQKKKERLEFGACMRRHIMSLSKKAYHQQFSFTPEFVVMFLPGEMFFHAALDADPDIIENASKNGIVIATPMMLVGLLKVIAFGFKHEAIAKNSEQVRELSARLIMRIQKVAEHFDRLGKNLKAATESYNLTLGSLESRVLATARQLSHLHLDDTPSKDEALEKGTLQLVETPVRTFQKEELLDESGKGLDAP